MAMDKINGSPLLQSGILDRFQGTKTDKNQSNKDTGSLTAHSNVSGTTTDKAEISDTAHQLMDLRQVVDAGRAALESLPEVREDKIQASKQRIADGFYNSAEVKQQVAEKLGSVLTSLDEL